MSPKFYYITISQASTLLPVFFGLAVYSKLSFPFRVLFYFFVACIGFEIQATVLKNIYGNNMPGLHLYTLVEFLVFSTAYYYHFQKNNVLRLFIGINAIFFITVCLADAFVVGSIFRLNSLSRSYSSVFMLCYALVYFYFMFRDDAGSYNTQHPMFWINIGIFIYFGSNILYFMLGPWLVHRANMAIIGLYYHGATNIVANCLFAQSFRCLRTKQIAW